MLAYDQLKGSAGSQIRYRPARYSTRNLFPNNEPRVRVLSNTYKLHDISLGGLSAISKMSGDQVLGVGDVVPLSIQQSGLPIFEADAKVCRSETTIFGSKIAFSFLDHHVEFGKLMARNTQAKIASRSAIFGTETNQLVPIEYRAFCADVLKLLRSYRAVLEDSSGTEYKFGRGLSPDEAFEACETRLVQQWRVLWRTGNDAVRHLMNDRDVCEATKEFTEHVLTPEMRLGAIWDRSYAKPLGYPGDFEIMNQVYDWQRLGNSAYEMLIHRIGLEVAECIETRMQIVRSHISQVVQDKGQQRTARILSLGSGPAREMTGFFSGHAGRAGRVQFTLIDQEQAALSYAFEHSYPHILDAKGGIDVQCLNMSFTDILRGNSALNAHRSQDLIYSVGLLDYLTDRRAAGLVRRLYDLLQPGGLMIIGNMNDCAMSNLWPMEFLMDWSLQYRNESQMLAWTNGLNPLEVWTETDSTERVRLLFIRKR